MEAKIAVVVLAGALLACGYRPSGDFTPKSVRTPLNQICAEAIELGEDDTGPVGEAGGVKVGVYEGDPSAMPVAHDIAYYGGTHYLARSGSTAYTSHGMLSRKHQDVRYDVYRVPVRAWDLLPAALRPSKP